MMLKGCLSPTTEVFYQSYHKQTLQPLSLFVCLFVCCVCPYHQLDTFNNRIRSNQVRFRFDVPGDVQ